jgi:hypothetical protein
MFRDIEKGARPIPIRSKMGGRHLSRYTGMIDSWNGGAVDVVTGTKTRDRSTRNQQLQLLTTSNMPIFVSLNETTPEDTNLVCRPSMSSEASLIMRSIALVHLDAIAHVRSRGPSQNLMLHKSPDLFENYLRKSIYDIEPMQNFFPELNRRDIVELMRTVFPKPRILQIIEFWL